VWQPCGISKRVPPRAINPGQSFFQSLVIHSGLLGLRPPVLGKKIIQNPIFHPLQKKKKKKEEIVTNLVDRLPMYDLQIAVTKSTRHNI
jgi:hypothetical protein